MLRAVEYERLDESRAVAFLCSVVMRLAADSHRRRQRHHRACVRVSGVESRAAAQAFEDAVCERHEAQWLAAALAGLRGRERQLMQARAEGRSVAEAAAELGISAKAAENAWTRVRGKAVRLLASAAGGAAAVLGGLRKAAPTAPVALALAGALAVLGAATAPFAPQEAAGPDPSAAGAAAGPRAARPAAAPPALRPRAAATTRPPQAPAAAVTAPAPPPVAEVGAVEAPGGVLRVGGTRVRREHEDESLYESLTRCVAEVDVADPLRDPCDYDEAPD